MVVIFEISPPFRFKPKLERFSFGWRAIWLYFAVAYFSNVGLNQMFRVFRQAGKDELIKAGWQPPAPGEPHGHS